MAEDFTMLGVKLSVEGMITVTRQILSCSCILQSGNTEDEKASNYVIARPETTSLTNALRLHLLTSGLQQ
jgi:hypothetical protein